MSKILELISDDIPAMATKFVCLIECDIEQEGGIPRNSVLKKEDSDLYDAFSRFIAGSQASLDLITYILLHLSEPFPEDSFLLLKWVTKDIQQRASLAFYPPEKLLEWAISDGEKWVDRSLRVVDDPGFNQRMVDEYGYLRMKKIIVHANHQYIYHCTLDILAFLNEQIWE